MWHSVRTLDCDLSIHQGLGLHLETRHFPSHHSESSDYDPGGECCHPVPQIRKRDLNRKEHGGFLQWQSRLSGGSFLEISGSQAGAILHTFPPKVNMAISGDISCHKLEECERFATWHPGWSPGMLLCTLLSSGQPCPMKDASRHHISDAKVEEPS